MADGKEGDKGERCLVVPKTEDSRKRIVRLLVEWGLCETWRVFHNAPVGDGEISTGFVFSVTELEWLKSRRGTIRYFDFRVFVWSEGENRLVCIDTGKTETPPEKKEKGSRKRTQFGIRSLKP